MALITCPACGKEISDKASTCIHCGYDLSAMKKEAAKVCPECGTELEDDAEVCPNCGCPIDAVSENNESEEVDVSEAIQTDAEQSSEQPENESKKKRKKGLIAIVIIVIIAVVAIAVGFGVHSRVQKQNAAQASETYGADVTYVSYAMLESASNAESAGNLIKNVWNNCIFKKADSTTDPYTKTSSGSFHSDFNTALQNLFNDSGFKAKIATIETEQSTITSKVKEMQNPPDEWTEAYNAMLEFYDAYNTLVNVVVNPSGNLQTFSSNFNDADSDVVNAYNKMELYLN